MQGTVEAGTEFTPRYENCIIRALSLKTLLPSVLTQAHFKHEVLNRIRFRYHSCCCPLGQLEAMEEAKHHLPDR